MYWPMSFNKFGVCRQGQFFQCAAAFVNLWNRIGSQNNLQLPNGAPTHFFHSRAVWCYTRVFKSQLSWCKKYPLNRDSALPMEILLHITSWMQSSSKIMNIFSQIPSRSLQMRKSTYIRSWNIKNFRFEIFLYSLLRTWWLELGAIP